LCCAYHSVVVSSDRLKEMHGLTFEQSALVVPLVVVNGVTIPQMYRYKYARVLNVCHCTRINSHTVRVSVLSVILQADILFKNRYDHNNNIFVADVIFLVVKSARHGAKNFPQNFPPLAHFFSDFSTPSQARQIQLQPPRVIFL
jgi:hypothetical protein